MNKTDDFECSQAKIYPDQIPLDSVRNLDLYKRRK